MSEHSVRGHHSPSDKSDHKNELRQMREYMRKQELENKKLVEENKKNNEELREMFMRFMHGEGPSRASREREEHHRSRSHHSPSPTHYSEGFRSSHHDMDYYQRPPRHHRPRHEHQPHREPKLDLPPFHGRDNIDEFLDWEMKVEQIFACHKVSEDRKVSMATLSFQGHAMYWWTSLEKEKRIRNEPPIMYWNELRSALRRRHVPTYYERELLDKLQRLQQRNLSVEEYRQNLELLMLRGGIREEERTTIARFMSGLNLEIRDKVELLPYRDLDDLVQICIKVELQLKRKTKKESTMYPRKESTYPKKDFKKEGQTSYSKSKPLEKNNLKEKSSNDSRTSSIKCFKCLGRGHIASQCPTKKTMIIRGEEVVSETSSSSSSSSDNEVHSSSSEEVPHSGDLFVAQRLLASQPKDEQTQRENLFHTRCKIFKKTCSLIVDSGSCNNFVSERLVSKLDLTPIAHPKSYKLSWLNEDGPIEVKHQVNVPFSIGKYKDEVLCDVIPMDASHILLGRPWQYDRKAIHDGVTNRIRLVHLGRKHTLAPLSPSQVMEDQISMKKKLEKEKHEKKSEKKKPPKS